MKDKCFICQSENIKINKKKFECFNCGFVNVNYQKRKEVKSEQKRTHKLLHKENLLKIRDIKIFSYFYNELLNMLLICANISRKESDDVDFKKGVSALSFNFQNNLKGLFEEIELKYKLIKDG